MLSRLFFNRFYLVLTGIDAVFLFFFFFVRVYERIWTALMVVDDKFRSKQFESERMQNKAGMKR